MTRENLLDAIGEISSDMIVRYADCIAVNIEIGKNNRAYAYKPRQHNFKKMQSIAASVVIVIAVMVFGTGVAYAVVPSFRELINSVLFPKYTADEMVSVGEGHMAGSFDIEDVLLTFLERYNKGKWGDDVPARYDNGFVYELYRESDDSVIALAESVSDECVIAVFIQKIEYAGTIGMWQVEGYRIINNDDADALTEGYPRCSIEDLSAQVDLQEKSGADTMITASSNEVLLYNVNDKTNIISVEPEDAEVILSLLSGHEYEQLAFEGITQYVVKTDNVSYQFDSRGNVVVYEDMIKGMFRLDQEELDAIKGMFLKYGVSLVEIR